MEKTSIHRPLPNIDEDRHMNGDWDPYVVWQKKIMNGQPAASRSTSRGEPDRNSHPLAVWKALFRSRN